MAKDFEQIGHKNIELLCFYLGKDISKIDKKIQDGESNLLGYFIASLVDILIVLFFDQGLQELLTSKIDSDLLIVGIKILCIVGLLFVFLLVVWAVKFIRNFINIRRTISGKKAYKVKDEQQSKIDDFDNIACDGLLICQNYIQRYGEADQDYVKEFYLYEIIHHLDKARIIFMEIYRDKILYIATQENDYNTELIDTYRVNNFITFAKAILVFLNEKIPEKPDNEDLKRDMDNLREKIGKWELLK